MKKRGRAGALPRSKGSKDLQYVLYNVWTARFVVGLIKHNSMQRNGIADVELTVRCLLSSGNDPPCLLEWRLYGTGLKVLVNSSSTSAWRDYDELQDMSGNVAARTRIEKPCSQILIRTENYSTTIFSALSILIIILLTAYSILLKITVSGTLLASCWGATHLNVIRNKKLHPETQHKISGFKRSVEMELISSTTSCSHTLLRRTIK